MDKCWLDPQCGDTSVTGAVNVSKNICARLEADEDGSGRCPQYPSLVKRLVDASGALLPGCVRVRVRVRVCVRARPRARRMRACLCLFACVRVRLMRASFWLCVCVRVCMR